MAIPRSLKVVNGLIAQVHPCGGCTACCSTLVIRELKKPMYVRCQHAGSDCCTIYPDRPKSCRDFVCDYATGVLGPVDKWRPDQCGIMCRVEQGPPPRIELYEVVPGALDNRERVRFLVGKMKEVYRNTLDVYEIPYGLTIGVDDKMDGRPLRESRHYRMERHTPR